MANRICSHPGCWKPQKSRGMCGMHYERLRLSGGLAPTRLGPNASAREKLLFYGWDVSPSGCWEWRGGRLPTGYGRLTIPGTGLAVATHRLAYELWVAPIPDGAIIRHTCDNPPCVNPDHLVTGTTADNMRDKVERNRQQKGSQIPNSKLCEADVKEIRSLYATGMFQNAIANRFGVSKATICLIVNNRTWRHVA